MSWKGASREGLEGSLVRRSPLPPRYKAPLKKAVELPKEQEIIIAGLRMHSLGGESAKKKILPL